MRLRALAARPALLVLFTIIVLAGGALVFGWGGDESFRTWPYDRRLSGTVTQADSRYDVEVLVPGLPPAARDPVTHRPTVDVEFVGVPAVGSTVAVRCGTVRDDEECVGEDLYRRYRSEEAKDAIVPTLGLLGILAVLVSCGLSIVRWGRVWRRDRAEGLRELQVGVATFVVGALFTVAGFYLALVRVAG